MQNIEPLCIDFRFFWTNAFKLFFTKYRTPLNFKSLLGWESRYYEKKDTNSEGVEEEYSSYMFWGKKEKIRSAINLPLFFHLL